MYSIESTDKFKKITKKLFKKDKEQLKALEKKLRDIENPTDISLSGKMTGTYRYIQNICSNLRNN